MINLTDAQLQGWLAMLIWPLARILGVFMTAPFFSEQGIPMQVRLLLGIFITLAIAPTLGPLPAVSVGSWAGIAVLIREIVIGSSLGLILQVLYGAVSLAGELAGTGMGLGFSTLYDPNSASSTTSVTAVLTTLAGLVFFAIDGHLALIGGLAQTFQTLPVAEGGLHLAGMHQLAAYGGVLVMHGLVMALPVTMTLIIVNIALGMLSRAAPQLNIFSIGFPITLGSGLLLLTLGMPEWLRAFDRLWGVAISAVARTAATL